MDWAKKRRLWREAQRLAESSGEQMAPTIIIGLVALYVGWRVGALGDISGSGMALLALIAVGSPIFGYAWVLVRKRLRAQASLDAKRAAKNQEYHERFQSAIGVIPSPPSHLRTPPSSADGFRR